MESIFNFLTTLIQFVLIMGVILVVIAFLGYNKLRGLSESLKEAFANIGVVSRKQASLVNQLIDVVKGYQESEKLVMLKVSEDMTNAAKVAQLHQQAGMVLSSVNGLADRFPELKANQQYLRLIDSIQACEAQLEEARSRYNSTVKTYNTARSTIPAVFYSSALGFKPAIYLEFDANNQLLDEVSLKHFNTDDDGERLNALLGKAGEKITEVTHRTLDRTLDVSKAATQKALEGGRQATAIAQEKIGEIRRGDRGAGSRDPDSKTQE